MRIDNHVHSSFSTDSEESAVHQCEAARKAGLDGLCFTEHVDYDMPYIPPAFRPGSQPPGADAETLDVDPDWFVADVDAYLSAIPALRRQFPDIQVHVGLEIGDHTSARAKYLPLLERVGPQLDYVLLSRHLVEGTDPFDQRFFHGRTRERAYEAYLRACLRTVTTIEDYDAFSHLGYAGRYAPYPSPALEWSDGPELIDAILRAVIERGKALEVNTSSLKHIGQCTPTDSVLKRYSELGGEFVIFGSDAHSRERVGDSLAYAAELARGCGCGYSVHYVQRKPVYARL